MAHYFASDVHLRFDLPDRDRRFRTWLCGLGVDDTLVIAGDLCDFWMASRSTENELLQSESLRALAEFRRQGATVMIMPGNHDAWLCPFYERELKAQIIAEPIDFSIHGLRLRLLHGHLMGVRRAWKGWMETRAFFEAFRRVPGPLAGTLDKLLSRNNERGLSADEERHLRVYRAYAARCGGEADLVVIGHVHRPVDDAAASPRLIVLGGWQRQSSYLKIDATGASFRIVDDDAGPPGTGRALEHETVGK